MGAYMEVGALPEDSSCPVASVAIEVLGRCPLAGGTGADSSAAPEGVWRSLWYG